MLYLHADEALGSDLLANCLLPFELATWSFFPPR